MRSQTIWTGGSRASRWLAFSAQRNSGVLPFEVGPETLVPRPETEVLVEAVLSAVAGRRNDSLSLCDLGTGSGAIAIALLRELPGAHGVALDISEGALDIARRNAEALGVAGRLSFCHGDFARQPEGRFDLVVSNPPYIRSSVIAGLEREVRDYDPMAALDGGADGLDAYRSILARIPGMLNRGGLLALEVGHDQSEAVAALCRGNMLNQVAVDFDLAGIPRVVTAWAAE
jgi:release factor glutamine methyltransferase